LRVRAADPDLDRFRDDVFTVDFFAGFVFLRTRSGRRLAPSRDSTLRKSVRDRAFDEQLGELATLRLALERHDGFRSLSPNVDCDRVA
jgi:hypothetical protein